MYQQHKQQEIFPASRPTFAAWAALLFSWVCQISLHIGARQWSTHSRQTHINELRGQLERHFEHQTTSSVHCEAANTIQVIYSQVSTTNSRLSQCVENQFIRCGVVPQIHL